MYKSQLLQVRVGWHGRDKLSRGEANKITANRLRLLVFGVEVDGEIVELVVRLELGDGGL